MLAFPSIVNGPDTERRSTFFNMPYSPPRLLTRTTQQASLFLVGYVFIGDRGARDLLELLFPEPGQTQHSTHDQTSAHAAAGDQ